MLRILIDTSIWLDIVKDKRADKLLATILWLHTSGKIEILTTDVVRNEFSANRTRVEESMNIGVLNRLKPLINDIAELGNDEERDRHAQEVLKGLAHHLPMLGAMKRVFIFQIGDLLENNSIVLQPSDRVRGRALDRGLEKKAPFHRGKNSVADALIIETFAEFVEQSTEGDFAFATSNHADFSQINGDTRLPHPDLEVFKRKEVRYALGVSGVEALLKDYFGGDVFAFWETALDSIEPHGPPVVDEIIEAALTYGKLSWYHRLLRRDFDIFNTEDDRVIQPFEDWAGIQKGFVEKEFAGDSRLTDVSDYNAGLIVGRMSALQWVLGGDWEWADAYSVHYELSGGTEEALPDRGSGHEEAGTHPATPPEDAQ